VNIPTKNQLFEHVCQLKDMKLSAYNPKSLTYYCQICGGKLIIEKDIRDWGDLFGDPINLKLSKSVLTKVLRNCEDQARIEEEELDKKDREARRKAEEVRVKAETAQKQKEEEVRRKLEEEARIRSEEVEKEIKREIKTENFGQNKSKKKKKKKK
jgi:hypothetical protein